MSFLLHLIFLSSRFFFFLFFLRNEYQWSFVYKIFVQVLALDDIIVIYSNKIMLKQCCTEQNKSNYKIEGIYAIQPWCSKQNISKGIWRLGSCDSVQLEDTELFCQSGKAQWYQDYVQYRTMQFVGRWSFIIHTYISTWIHKYKYICICCCPGNVWYSVDATLFLGLT